MYLIGFIGLLVMCVPACVSVSQIGGGAGAGRGWINDWS